MGKPHLFLLQQKDLDKMKKTTALLILILLLIFGGTEICRAQTLNIKGTVKEIDHKQYLLTILSGKSTEVKVHYDSRTKFIGNGNETISVYSVLPGDGIDARVPQNSKTASIIIVNGKTIAGELIFINKKKILLAGGEQIYLHPETSFYINGLKANFNAIKKRRRVFLRINPATSLAGSLYQTDIVKKTISKGSIKSKIYSLEKSPEGNFRKDRVINFKVKASSKKNVSADIPGIAMNIPLKEVKPGVYAGRYIFKRNDVRRTYPVAKIIDKSGEFSRISPKSLDVAVSPPIIEIIHPVPNSQLKRGDIEVFARLKSPGTLIKAKSITVHLNGRLIQSGIEKNVGFVSCSLPRLKKGNYRVKITVADEAGNVSSGEWKFSIK